MYSRKRYAYRQSFYDSRKDTRGIYTRTIRKKQQPRSKTKYITEQIKFVANIIKVGDKSVNYLSLPSLGTKEDQLEKSVIMLKSLYITGGVKVLKLPEQNMMLADEKATYILQGVVGVFFVKDKSPLGTKLPKFKDIFDDNDNYKADALSFPLG